MSALAASSSLPCDDDILFNRDPPTRYEFGRNDLLRSGYDG
jgi:hypothetical protein